MLSTPQFPIQAAELDGFCQVMGLDGFAGIEVGNGAGDAEDAVVGADRKTQFFHGLAEQFLASVIE